MKILDKDAKIFVAGHRGMVGSAICRQLENYGLQNVIVRSHQQLDLCKQFQVAEFMQQEKPDFVVLAAAKVGGIHANNEFPAEFIYQNLMIQANVINSAFEAGVKHLLFLGSSCIYPKLAEQPMSEEALLTGLLEPTNEPYAIAKIAGIKLCESYNRQYGVHYRSVMPTNLYGPNDNFHLENSHVIPALFHKFHQAKINQDPQVIAWGTGKPKREFLYVDDMAAASVHVMQLSEPEYVAHTQPMLSHINVGTGQDVTIRELTETISTVVGFQGEVVFDASKPDGAPRKLMDSSRLKALGWEAKISLRQGLEQTYEWFLGHEASIRQ